MTARVWIISELYYPEETSTGYFLTKIAEGLAEKLPVSVLCSQPTYAARHQKAPYYENRKGVEVRRCWGTTFNKDILLLRLLNVMTAAITIFLNAVRLFRKGDCVLVVTTPPSLPFIVSLACHLRRTRCILLIHDVYPEVLVAAGICRRGSILTRAIGKITRALYGQMNDIVVLGRDMASLVQLKLSANSPRIMVIPNWADLDFVQPVPRPKNTLLSNLGLAQKFVIQYSGNIGRTHGIEYLVDGAERFLNDPGVHFLFIGFGGKRAWLAETIKERGLANTTLMDYRPRSELPISLNACDVAVISFVEGMAGISVPSRMYNVMAAGKPIIAMADVGSELAQVVKEENIGWVVSPGDIDSFCQVIVEARNNPQLLVDMGQRARRAAEAKYSFKHINQTYIDLIQSYRA